MTDTARRVHYAELGRYVGWSFAENSPRGEVYISGPITAVKHANFHMIVGLDSVKKTLAIDENVRLWRPADKISHLNDAHRRNGPLANLATVVSADRLPEHIGWLAFLDSGGPGFGPHIILDCEIVGGRVHLTISSTEVVGKYDMMVEIAKPPSLQTREISA